MICPTCLSRAVRIMTGGAECSCAAPHIEEIQAPAASSAEITTGGAVGQSSRGGGGSTPAAELPAIRIVGEMPLPQYPIPSIATGGTSSAERLWHLSLDDSGNPRALWGFSPEQYEISEAGSNRWVARVQDLDDAIEIVTSHNRKVREKV